MIVTSADLHQQEQIKILKIQVAKLERRIKRLEKQQEFKANFEFAQAKSNGKQGEMCH